jgi:hypothetical protein
MLQLKGLKRTYSIAALAVRLSVWVTCPPVASPTLDEVRFGSQLPADMTLQPGEIRGEVIEIDPSRHEIRLQTDDGRRQVLEYDTNLTRVAYHGREHNVGQLQTGDLIVFSLTFPWLFGYFSARYGESLQRGLSHS